MILQTDMRIFFLPILLVEMPQNLLLAVVLTHCKATSAEVAETQIAKKKKKKEKTNKLIRTTINIINSNSTIKDVFPKLSQL